MLIAYHGDPAVKEKYLARMRAHIAADELIHGTYWERGKGCAVGCTVHSGDHGAYERELGIPRILARLEDGIFESLPNGKSKLWPEKFLSAIEPGADLAMVWPQFAVWMLTDSKWGVVRFAKTEKSKKAIFDISDAYGQVVSGSKVSLGWGKLRAAAYYAAADASADSDASAAARGAQAEKLLQLMSAAPVVSGGVK